jgi:hypothetical protein
MKKIVIAFVILTHVYTFSIMPCETQDTPKSRITRWVEQNVPFGVLVNECKEIDQKGLRKYIFDHIIDPIIVR